MKEYWNGLEIMGQVFVQPAENSSCVIKVKKESGGGMNVQSVSCPNCKITKKMMVVAKTLAQCA